MTSTTTAYTDQETSLEEEPAERTADETRSDGQSAAPTDPKAGGDPRPGLSRDLLFESLKNSRRRQVVRYLGEHEPPVTLGELAEHVAAIENDTTVRELSSQQRKRVYVGLYQCHLPKLDDMDIVEYDKNRGRVEPGPNVGELEPYLAVEDDDEPADHPGRSRDLLVGGLAGASATTVCVGALGILGGIGVTASGVLAGIGVLAGAGVLSLAGGGDVADRLPLDRD